MTYHFSLPLELLRDSWLNFLYKLNLVFRKKSCSKQEWKIAWICVPASYRRGFKVLNTGTDPWNPENSELKGDTDFIVVKNDIRASLAPQSTVLHHEEHVEEGKGACPGQRTWILVQAAELTAARSWASPFTSMNPQCTELC